MAEKDEFLQQVDIEVTGGFRRVALNVEADSFRLTRVPGGGRTGTHKVKLEPPAVDVFISAKGAPDAVLDLAVKINNKTRTAHYVLRGGGLHHFHAQFELKEFDL